MNEQYKTDYRVNGTKSMKKETLQRKKTNYRANGQNVLRKKLNVDTF